MTLVNLCWHEAAVRTKKKWEGKTRENASRARDGLVSSCDGWFCMSCDLCPFQLLIVFAVAATSMSAFVLIVPVFVVLGDTFVSFVMCLFLLAAAAAALMLVEYPIYQPHQYYCSQHLEEIYVAVFVYDYLFAYANDEMISFLLRSRLLFWLLFDLVASCVLD